MKLDDDGDLLFRISKTKTLDHGFTSKAVKRDHFCSVDLTKRYLAALTYPRLGSSRLSSDSLCMQPRLFKSKGVMRVHEKYPLSHSQAIKNMRQVMSLIGQDPACFGEHSTRRGGATASAEAGASLSSIMSRGNWKSSSSATRYIDTDKDDIHSFIVL